MTRVYDEIVDFIANGSSRAAVADWTPSSELKDRVSTLLHAESAGTLTADERAELNHFLELEHLMRLAKARARQQQGHE